jgi:signal transduction histidine kinase
VDVQGDPRLLRRMVRNLLENARRHGAPPVEVTVKRDGNAVRLQVCDRGRGIPDAERERIFEPFYRLPGSSGNVGVGLGLALVRQIARRHGGDAKAAPRNGGGTCIGVTLAL